MSRDSKACRSVFFRENFGETSFCDRIRRSTFPTAESRPAPNHQQDESARAKDAACPKDSGENFLDLALNSTPLSLDSRPINQY